MADVDMAKAPPARPARPRHAASLVLLRGNTDSPEVLLGRRPMTARFMPGVYVFPGGALERGDHAVASSLEFEPDVIDRVARHYFANFFSTFISNSLLYCISVFHFLDLV